jgi:hypothetical protein
MNGRRVMPKREKRSRKKLGKRPKQRGKLFSTENLLISSK